MKHLKKQLAFFSIFSSLPYSIFAATADWPWVIEWEAWKAEFTGPVPLTLGIIGISLAAISMFQGNAGEGTKKLFGIIFGVSIALYATEIVSAITGTAAGLLLK